MKFFKFLLIAALFICITPHVTYAQKGRSYSSGSRSFSKPSSPSKSFSPSKPSVSKPSPSKPSVSKPSPSKPSVSKPSPSVANKPSYSSDSGKTYSGKSSTSNNQKPASSSFNRSLSSSAKKVESQNKYKASSIPKATYKTPGPSGVEKPIQPSSPQVQTVRRYVTHERYVTYNNRASVFYGSYYSSPMYYHDSFSPFLMGWLMSSSLNSHDRATWMYHHQNDMDRARYDELLRKDANLQAEIDQLKGENVPIDPAYVPPQMGKNPDLMFNKEFVDASYNPEVDSEFSLYGFLFNIGFFISLIALLFGFIYFFFVREYK